MKIIGITGGVGAGKSQVVSYIKEHYKAVCLLADEVGNEVKEPGGRCYEDIVNLLGQDILLEDGTIDRRRMANKIFEDKNLLNAVNDIIHPAVIATIKEKAAKAKESGEVDYFFVEAALLIESGLTDFVDELWYIYADDKVRKKRLKDNRGYTGELIDSIMAKQLKDEEFRAHADVVIDNSNELEDTYLQIDKRLK